MNLYALTHQGCWIREKHPGIYPLPAVKDQLPGNDRNLRRPCPTPFLDRDPFVGAAFVISWREFRTGLGWPDCDLRLWSDTVSKSASSHHPIHSFDSIRLHPRTSILALGISKTKITHQVSPSRLCYSHLSRFSLSLRRRSPRPFFRVPNTLTVAKSPDGSTLTTTNARTMMRLHWPGATISLKRQVIGPIDASSSIQEELLGTMARTFLLVKDTVM